MDRILAVITAKNEGDSIAHLVHSLKQDYQVIVVDDGSIDNTGELAKSNGAEIISHFSSRGIALSLMEAWHLALDKGADYIVQIDAGNSHDPVEASNLVRVAIESKIDIVIGSRFCKGAIYRGRTWRAFVSRCMAGLMSAIVRTKITDWTSGYRVFSRRSIEKLLFRAYLSRMHAWQMEVLLYALEENLSIAECPITYRAGKSSLNFKAMKEAAFILIQKLFINL